MGLGYQSFKLHTLSLELGFCVCEEPDKVRSPAVLISGRSWKTLEKSMLEIMNINAGPVEPDIPCIKSCKSCIHVPQTLFPLLMQPAPSHNMSSMSRGDTPETPRTGHRAQYPRAAGMI
jgi:hypothetical protein